MTAFITEICPGDREVFREILASSGYFYDFEIDVALSLADETLEKGDEGSGYYWVKLVEDGVIAAFANFGPNPSSVHSWDLYWIAVHEAFRKKHLGSALLSKAEERIRELGGKIVWIETSGRPLYVPTRSFYIRNGYTLEATLPEFYGPGDDKIIYRKVL